MHKRTHAQVIWITQNPSGKGTGTLVESLPLKDVDNITITLAAVALGHWLVK